jgi:septal ring factor EnvC (AmiA/AmiB activator)
VDADLKRLADAAERLESQARELRGQIETLAAEMRARAEAAAARAAEEETAQPSAATPGVDDSEARIVAYSMVLDGRSREEVARHLAHELGSSNSDALLDDLYARES